MPVLTKIQAKVCDFIRDFAASNGYPPTRLEIAEHFGWRSPNAAEVHVQALVKKGAVTSKRGISRSLRVISEQ